MNVLLTRHDAPIFRRIAGEVRPRGRVRPSAWVEKHMQLTRAMNAELVGPFRCSFKPWLRAWIDALHDHPEKKGVVAPKPAQNALTMGLMMGLAARCGTRDGWTLYVIGRKEGAEKLVSDRWDKIEEQPALRGRFARGREESARNVLAERKFDGGGIDFVGAGSAGSLSSTTYGIVVLDEYDQAQANFPSRFGDIHAFAVGRQTAVLGDKEVWIFSHPTLADTGIDAIYQRESDMGRWVFDCPHCGNPATLTSACIKFRGLREGQEPDPDLAVVECPRCGREISDRDRQREVWGPELGGTGRLWTDLDPATAARRPYLGFAINGLCNPAFGVAYFARLLLSGKRGGEEAEQSTLNVIFGEAKKPSGAIADPAVLRETFAAGRIVGGRVAVPGGEHGVRFVTMGCDVQFAGGRAHVTGGSVGPGAELLFYCCTVAWAASGMGYIVDLRKVLGWASWYDLVRSLAVVIQEGTPEAGLVAPLSAVGIDSKYQTQQVLEHCRERVYSPIDQRLIELIPMQYEPQLRADRPVVVPPDEKRRHPTRPELGLLDRYYTHRHTFVNRAMMRWMGKREVVLCDVPPDYVEHLTANQLRPVKREHGLEPEAVEWVRPDKLRDDWLQAKANAEAVAAVRCGLDSIHETPSLGGEGGMGLRLAAPTLAGVRDRRIER